MIPIANTVGSVGRKTGVEHGMRWFLRRRQSHGGNAEEEGQGSSKRRKLGAGDSDYRDTPSEPGSGAQTPRASFDNRRLSITSTVDTLPAYDEFRAPPYAEQPGSDGFQNRAPWQSRLYVSTSALGCAMTEEGLRSLKYCLRWIRWANVHLGNVVNSLTIIMEKYEQTSHDASGDHSMQGHSNEEPVDRNQLAAKIDALRLDVLKTLQDVINTVSRHAGGSLPENARELVRRHLTSLPQRFRVASLASSREASSRAEANMEERPRRQEQKEEKETRESAQRVLLLAKEGLEMMSQVSGVLDGTITSAEAWCERLGMKKREQKEDLVDIPQYPQTRLDDKTG